MDRNSRIMYDYIRRRRRRRKKKERFIVIIIMNKILGEEGGCQSMYSIIII